MKKLLIILLFVPFLVRAQTVEDYMMEFKSDAINYGKRFSVPDPIIILRAEMLYPRINGRYINAAAYVDHDIKTIFFSTISSSYCTELKVLVYHELGHYYLNRNHRPDLDAETGMEISIMAPVWYNTWDDLLLEEQQEYIDELFTYY